MTRAERMKQAIRHRQEQEKEELRRKILEAASELFVEQGYERFSMRQLAERIGYSATTIYLYFRDKDDLLFTVVDEGFARFRRQLEAVAARISDPQQRLIELGRTYIQFGLAHPTYYQLMFMQRTDFLLSPSSRTGESRYEAFQILQESVQQAIDAAILRAGDAQCYSDLMWAQMHGIVSLAISMPILSGDRLRKLVEAGPQVVMNSLLR